MRHHLRMDDQSTDDDPLIANLIRDVALDVLERIGDDAEARYQYFRAFIDLSQHTVEAQRN